MLLAIPDGVFFLSPTQRLCKPGCKFCESPLRMTPPRLAFTMGTDSRTSISFEHDLPKTWPARLLHVPTLTSYECRFNHERPLVSEYGEHERPVYLALFTSPCLTPGTDGSSCQMRVRRRRLWMLPILVSRGEFLVYIQAVLPPPSLDGCYATLSQSSRCLQFLYPTMAT